MAISPVRTISTSPWGRTIRSKASDRTSARRPLPIPRSRAPRRDSVVTTGDGDLAGADHFDQPVGADHPLEGLDFVGRAGDLDGHRAAGDVDDFGAEDLGELDDLGAVLDRGGDLEQGHLAGDGVLRLHVADLQHVDELVQLLRHLVDRVDGAVWGQGDGRDPRVGGRAAREGVDVEAATGEEPGDARQHARLVLDRDREDVLAAGQLPREPQILQAQQIRGPGLHQESFPWRLATSPGASTMSRAALPGAIIGYTFSSWVTRTSTRTGPSVSIALVIVSARSADSSTRRPVAPKASASFTQSGLVPLSTEL